LYTELRHDRSGAAVQDMLYAHAYCFREGIRYGGACPNPNPLPPSDSNNSSVSSEVDESRTERFRKLLRGLGLDEVLPVACPPAEDEDDEEDENSSRDEKRRRRRKKSAIFAKDRFAYAHEDAKLWTSEWLEHVRSRANYGYRHESLTASQNKPTTTAATATAVGGTAKAVMHIRRGDVHPCSNSSYERYLPNWYYRTLIERSVLSSSAAAANLSSLTIYSESDSYEPWDDLLDEIRQLQREAGNGQQEQRQLQLSLRLDTPDLLGVWNDMMTADAFVMSKSSFSVVPAVLNRNEAGVVYTPFWHEPLPKWRVADPELARSAAKWVEDVRRNVCPETGFLK